MAYIKWIKSQPFVYKSLTSKTGHQRDVYISTYREYRYNKPSGRFEDMVKPQTVLLWVARLQWRINLLKQIDTEIKIDNGL